MYIPVKPGFCVYKNIMQPITPVYISRFFFQIQFMLSTVYIDTVTPEFT